MSAGAEMRQPNYSDAIPPTPPKQGSMGEPHYTNPNTFESGMPPEARDPKESGWEECKEAFGHPVRGYRPEPVGGTATPNNRK